jgi:N-acetylglutamate synthase-like GNAT family acetyltransferase
MTFHFIPDAYFLSDNQHPWARFSLRLLKTWYAKSNVEYPGVLLLKNCQLFIVRDKRHAVAVVLLSRSGDMMHFHLLAAPSRMLSHETQVEFFSWLEERARHAKCPKLFTIVAESNARAIRLLEIWGFPGTQVKLSDGRAFRVFCRHV